MKLKYLALMVFALCSLTVAAAQASAKHRSDRATQKVRIADNDRDLASNRCERQAELKTHRRDSDRDGRLDGREDSDDDGANNAAESILRSHCDSGNSRRKIDDAVIVSYSASDGLTLGVGRQGLITAPVDPDFVCEQEVEDEGTSDDDSEIACSSADLVPGVEVDEAKIRNGSFVKIELEEVEHADSDDDHASQDDDEDDDDCDDD